MNRLEGKIVHLLTGKERLEDVSVEELQKVAASQPYFSVAQLLLTKKMQQIDHPGYQQQLEKTALYFPNAHWLRYQLMDEHELLEPVAINNNDTYTGNHTDNSAAQTSAITIEEHESPIEEILEQQEETDYPTLPAEKLNTTGEEITLQHESQPEHVIPQETFIPTLPVEDPGIAAKQIAPDENSPDENRPLIEAENLPPKSFPEPVSDVAGSTTEVNATDEPLTEKSAEQTGNIRLAEMMQQQAEEFKKPVDELTPLPVITEPYHTIDYFASQGIRLSAQQQQDDKLGKQVKKFTDWLKQMKKIGPAEVQTDPEMEHKVQDTAENSNETKEVVTEAMAEVLVKQGKMDKAIQLYIKLSFLNPDKSAYFAARIEELKGL